MLMQSPITDRRTSPPLLSIGPKLLEVADRERVTSGRHHERRPDPAGDGGDG